MTAAGTYAIDVYYTASAATSLKLKVNNTAVNGSGAGGAWDFAAGPVWSMVTINVPASVTPAGITSIQLIGPGAGKSAPVVEGIVIRLP
jgi:hypothetical protein